MRETRAPQAFRGRRFAIRNQALALGLALSVAFGGYGRAADPSMVRLPDGRRLHLVCTGHGGPVVVLESGFGATADAWFKVQPVLAQQTRVCAYDRAGYGLSDPGPDPRDGKAIAQDLDDGLRAAKIKGPFVMVGHSAGGLYVRLFADRRPRDVVGMVLVDPSVEYQDRQMSKFGPNAASLDPIKNAVRRCLDRAEGRLSNVVPTADELRRCYGKSPVSGRPGALLPPSLWRTELSELDTLWGVTSDEVAEGRASYGDLPLVVLTAADTNKGVPEPLRAAVDARWSQVHVAVARRSRRGVERVVERASHLIMIDRPDAVVQAVQEVMSEAAIQREAH